MAKFKTLSFCQKIFLWYQISSCTCSMCLLCVCKVSDGFSIKLWYKLISPCMYYLSTNKTLIKKQCIKWLSSKGCHFVKKYFYGIKLLRANVQCVYIVYTKYQDVSVKAVEQVEFPIHAQPMQHLELQRAITRTELTPSP